MENIGLTSRQLDSETALLQRAVSKGTGVGQAPAVAAKPATLNNLHAQSGELIGECARLAEQLETLLGRLRGDAQDESNAHGQVYPEPPSILDCISSNQGILRQDISRCHELVSDLGELLLDDGVRP